MSDPVVQVLHNLFLNQFAKKFSEVLEGQRECDRKQHFQQVAVSVHANQYTRICFNCYILEFCELPRDSQ